MRTTGVPPPTSRGLIIEDGRRRLEQELRRLQAENRGYIAQIAVLEKELAVFQNSRQQAEALATALTEIAKLQTTCGLGETWAKSGAIARAALAARKEKQ